MQGDVNWLYRHDQLRGELEAKRAFQGLAEVDLVTNFLPTYKYEPGTDIYDQRPEKKLRAPAWTDRILWRPAPNSKCLSYDKVDDLRISDHKPVEACLSLMGRVVNDLKRQDAYHEVLRRLDLGAAVLAASQLIVEPQVLDFGNVVYRQHTSSKAIVLKNNGAAPVAWRIAPRPGDDTLCAPWVSLAPTFGMLLPGDHVQVKVEVELGLDAARTAVSQRLFADVLDFRFHPLGPQPEQHTISAPCVSVQATLQPTCFGAHLASLSWAPLPIRLHGSGEVQYTLAKRSEAMVIPKELWRLIDALLSSGLDSYRIFLSHADPQDTGLIREALDCGGPFPSQVSQYALAACLLEFIDALAEPVVPVELVPDASEISSAEAETLWASNFLMQLPTPNTNVLGCLIGLTKAILARSEKNHVDLDLIAPVFAEIVFRPSEANEVNRENAAAQASGLGEFATWLTGSSAKTSDVKADKAVSNAFAALVKNTR